MKAYGSLFERLGGETEARSNSSPAQCAKASVAAHLAKMLSTRAGSVQTLPDYGLPDLNDMSLSLHESLNEARKAIERFIEAYEPRLARVKVIALENSGDRLKLAFTIEGLLEVNGLKHEVSFSARLNSSGQANVR